jgi:hypothetical protein
MRVAAMWITQTYDLGQSQVVVSYHVRTLADGDRKGEEFAIALPTRGGPDTHWIEGAELIRGLRSLADYLSTR